jgi:hypothetical protein
MHHKYQTRSTSGQKASRGGDGILPTGNNTATAHNNNEFSRRDSTCPPEANITNECPRGDLWHAHSTGKAQNNNSSSFSDRNRLGINDIYYYGSNFNHITFIFSLHSISFHWLPSISFIEY